jgi:biotin carboxylase
MRRALSEFVVAGVPTTIPFLLQVLDAPDFICNQIHTRWIEETFLAEKRAEPSLH